MRLAIPRKYIYPVTEPVDEECARRCRRLIIDGGVVEDELKYLTNRFDFSSVVRLDCRTRGCGVEDIKVLEDAAKNKFTRLQCLETSYNFMIFLDRDTNGVYSFLGVLEESKLLSCRLSFAFINGGARRKMIEREKLKLALEKICPVIEINRKRDVFLLVNQILPWEIRVTTGMIYDYLFGLMHIEDDGYKITLCERRTNDEVENRKELLADPTCIVVKRYGTRIVKDGYYCL